MVAGLVVLLVIPCIVAGGEGFDGWKLAQRRVYTSPEHEQRARKCFEGTVLEIKEMRVSEPRAEFKLNSLADVCTSELVNGYMDVADVPVEGSGLFSGEIDALSVGPVPKSLDWRTKGAVTPVKNQGTCGSCWTFGGVGAMEGAWFVGSGHLVSLSEEELVECATWEGHPPGNGCNGGSLHKGIEWVVTNGGIDSEADYPYTSSNGTTPESCNIHKRDNKKVARFSGMVQLPKLNATAIAAWMSTYGPVGTGVDAKTWKSYHSGVLTNCSSTGINHGVLLVGYGVDKGVDYWIIKNSWGPNWGEAGFIRVARGSDTCGVEHGPSAARY